MVQKAPACTIENLGKAVCELFGVKYAPKIIGVRHGEKLYETLLTREEYVRATDMGNFFRIPADSRDLNYEKYFEKGNEKFSSMEEYNSNNTLQLDVPQIKEKLLELKYVQDELAQWKAAKK